MQVSEKNLAEELQRRNTNALEHLMDTYSGKVYALVHRILGDKAKREDIEECTSDIFFSIWQNAHRYDAKRGTFRTWVFIVAKYKALDYRRQLCQAPQYPLYEEQINPQDDLESRILAKEEREQLVEAIETLGEPNKTLFYKRYFYYESIESIAQQLNLTRSAVDNRLWRCRQKVKEHLLLQRGHEVCEK